MKILKYNIALKRLWFDVYEWQPQMVGKNGKEILTSVVTAAVMMYNFGWEI